MTRIKRGTTANKRRKNLLQHTKGFRWGRKSKFASAKEAVLHAWRYAYRDRRNKKRDFRGLWLIQINAACREEGISYSKFIGGLKKKNIAIDRKILSSIGQKYPKIFEEILKAAG